MNLFRKEDLKEKPSSNKLIPRCDLSQCFLGAEHPRFSHIEIVIFFPTPINIIFVDRG